MAAAEVQVEGLADLNRALRRADKQTKAGVRKELRGVAEPIRADAQSLAGSQIRNIGGDWSKMRVGVTTDSVYVAPRKRGIKRRDDPKKRRNLAPLLMDRAMQPALDNHADGIQHEFEQMLDRVADNFSR